MPKPRILICAAFNDGPIGADGKPSYLCKLTHFGPYLDVRFVAADGSRLDVLDWKGPPPAKGEDGREILWFGECLPVEHADAQALLARSRPLP